MWLLLVAMAMPEAHAVSEIERDEVVVFYPTYAARGPDGKPWRLKVHGAVFKPEENSIRRAMLLGLLRRAIGLPLNDTANGTFQKRARAFLVDNKTGKTIHVRLAGQDHSVGKSVPGGHFRGSIELTDSQVALATPTLGSGVLTWQAIAPPADPRQFPGEAYLIEPTGVSIISDVDDTIKVTEVTDRRALLANTFLRKFEPVPGMASRYQKWKDEGAAFHYVSASPWQLYEPLNEFRRAEGFPSGSFHLKPFRLKDRTALDFFLSQSNYKPAVIEEILDDFPQRKFVLVGDSGEQDPEIYGDLARRRPEQIAMILIRDVLPKGIEPRRVDRAFDKLPRERWKVFKTADEIDLPLKALADGRQVERR